MVKAGQQAVGVRGQVQPHHVGLFVGHMVQKARVLVGEAVVVLLPHVGGQHKVEGGDLLPPVEVAGDLQPLGMLGGHGVHDADKCLVAVEEAVASGEQIALQPALAHMLGQHTVHDAAVRSQELVIFHHIGVPAAVGLLKDLSQAVGHGLVGAEHPEVAGVPVKLQHIPDVAAQLAHVLGLHPAGYGHVHGIFTEVGQPQVPQQLSAVGIGIGTHAAVALGGDLPQHPAGRTVFVKQLLEPVAAQPLFHQLQVFRLGHIHGDLVGAEGALNGLAAGLLDAGPALGGPQDDHGPAGAGGVALLTGLFLGGPDVPDALVQGIGHHPVSGHVVRAVSLHKIGLPAAAFKELAHLFLRNA